MFLLKSFLAAMADSAIVANIAIIQSWEFPAVVTGPPLLKAATIDWAGIILISFALVDPFIALTLGTGGQDAAMDLYVGSSSSVSALTGAR
mmetsp:Transcript_23975/g.60646  ORF Transcript_23975/g.60646 Transcript_23975/m.60646 type:complete len:91 (+) Transcript_23975:1085-1357(+)